MAMTNERRPQQELLETLLDPIAAPPAIAVHGPPSSGKSHLLKQLAKPSEHQALAYINVSQSITPRLVLQKALQQLSQEFGQPFDGSCENIQTFYLHLARFSSASQKRTLLVLDRIDTLESATSLHLAFSRSPELAPGLNLVVVFVYTSQEPKSFLSTAIPHVYFPRYTADEATAIIQRSGTPTPPSEFAEGQFTPFYHEFVRICVSALCPYTDTNIPRLERIIDRIWPRFIAGGCSTNFALQFREKAGLFTSEWFLDSLPTALQYDFPVATRYLLCAAYLASHNAERYDYRFFSRAKDVRAKRRKTAPRKETTIPERAKPGKVFELERMLAIYHALLPDSETFIATIDALTNLADLTSQNFITRSTPQSNFDDPLNSRTRWCVNISYQFAKELSESLGLDLEMYMVGEFTGVGE